MSVEILSQAQKAALTPEELELLDRFRVDPLRPGDTPENPLNEQLPETKGVRFAVKALSANPAVAQRFLEEQGYDVVPLDGYLDFSIRRRGDRKWYRIDPMGPELQDITDLGGDVLLGAGEGLGWVGGAALAPFTGPAAPAMPYAGASAGGALAEGLRQAIAKGFGMDPTAGEVGSSMAIEGAVGAAGPLLARGVQAVGRRIVPNSARELMSMGKEKFLGVVDDAARRAGTAAEGLPSRMLERDRQAALRELHGRLGELAQRPESVEQALRDMGAELLPQGTAKGRIPGGASSLRTGEKIGGRFFAPEEVAERKLRPTMRPPGGGGRFASARPAQELLDAARRQGPGGIPTDIFDRIEGLTRGVRQQMAADLLERQPLGKVWRFFDALAGEADEVAEGVRRGRGSFAAQRYPGNMGSAMFPMNLVDAGLRVVGKMGRVLARNMQPWRRIMSAEGQGSRLGRLASEVVERFTIGDTTGAKAMVYTILQRPEWRERIYKYLGGTPTEED